MASANNSYIIGQGTPTVVESTVQLLGVGADGTVGAKRIMTHPDSTTFPPVSYYRNPDFTVNLDNEVLTAPLATPILTLSSTQLVRFDTNLEDVIISEVWEGSTGRASMPTFLFRELYEYLINPPAFDAQNQSYISWQPRDRNTTSYDIQLYQITVGGGEGAQSFSMREIRLPESPVIANPLQTMDVSPTGLILAAVTVRFRIVRVTP